MNSALNSEAYSSFEEESSNYRIASAKTQLSLGRNKEQTGKTSWYKQSICGNCEKFDALLKRSEKHISDNKYINLVTAHIEAATEWILTKPRVKLLISLGVNCRKGKTRYDKKKSSLLTKRNPTNTNVQKPKKAQTKQTKMYNEKNLTKVKSIKSEIW